MSVDLMIEAAEDYAIWAANNPEAADVRAALLSHWVRTGHVDCTCPDRAKFRWKVT